MIERQRQARRELVIVAVAVVALSSLVDGPVAWLVAGLLLATMLVGTLQVLAEAMPDGVPIESLITPSVAAIACLGAIRLVPVGLLLIPALVGAGLLIEACLVIEARILTRVKEPTPNDRTVLLALSLLAAFLAFTGAAALVPGGLVEPAPAGATGTPPLPEQSMLALAAADAFVAFLLGYRFAALRVSRVRDAASAALGYALAIAIAAGLVRAVALPRLLGPALLTLVFFLWDSFRGTEPAARRDPRWIWQVILLAILGLVVVAWNLTLRG